MFGERDADVGEILKCSASKRRIGDGVAVVRNRNRAGILEGRQFSQLPTLTTLAHRADRQYSAIDILSPLQHTIDDRRRIHCWFRVGHRADRGESTPRSRSGSRSNRLFMFLPRFSQVRVEIDEPRRNHQSRGSHQHGSIRSSEIRSNLGDPPIDNQHVKPFIKPGSRINHTPAMDQDAAHEPPRISRKSTAIRTARPAETCASIRLCGPCATSTAISTPSFIGPGCITIASGDANATRSAVS